MLSEGLAVPGEVVRYRAGKVCLEDWGPLPGQEQAGNTKFNLSLRKMTQVAGSRRMAQGQHSRRRLRSLHLRWDRGNEGEGGCSVVGEQCSDSKPPRPLSGKRG